MQRVACLSCNKQFTASSKQRKQEIVRRHLEDHSSYRTIERRNGCAKNTANKYVREISKNVRDSEWIAKNLKPKWRGVLCFDGTYIRVKNFFAELERERGWCGEDERFLHKMSCLIGVDYHTRDLPHYSLGDNENMIDLVLYFQQLKKNEYDIKVLARDGNDAIQSAAEHVYGRSIPTQLCHYHFLKKFDEAMANKELENDKKHIQALKSEVCFCIRAKNILAACKRFAKLDEEKDRFIVSEATDVLFQKFENNFHNLVTYLHYPKGFVPTTVNVAENINKQLKDRLKPMCGLQTIRSAEDYLKLWCLKRRFQKFTDCKRPFKHFNGKAPLEIANCSISHLNFLSL